MEKKTIMEVIKENKDAIIRRTLIVLGSIGGLLVVSKLLMGDEEVEALDEIGEPVEDVEFSEEVENEEEK